MNFIKQAGVVAVLFAIAISATAQTKTLNLEEAVRLGVQNSKLLRLSKYKVDEAVSRLQQATDATLPSLKVSGGYSHALMLSRKFALPSSNGQDPKMLELPFDNSLYQATISVNEPIFAAHRFRYAKESADLLVRAGQLDADRDKDEVVYNIINAYINYYKIRQNQKIVAQNLNDVEQKLSEIQKFESQGLATKNDVLRFSLQRSNIRLMQIDLENTRKTVNYNLDILLGLPDSTALEVQDVQYKLDMNGNAEAYLQQALQDRKEFGSLKYQDKLADVNLKKIQSEKLPTVGVGGNLYYINPSRAFFPKSGSYLAPFVIGVNASWDIGELFRNKNKLGEAAIQKNEVDARRDLVADKIKVEVNQSHIAFQQDLEKIKVLEEAVVQATENERIMESKFRNSLATTTDRIEAQTLLYQSRVSLELAKADATIAYYNLLKATGHIQP